VSLTSQLCFKLNENAKLTLQYLLIVQIWPDQLTGQERGSSLGDCILMQRWKGSTCNNSIYISHYL